MHTLNACTVTVRVRLRVRVWVRSNDPTCFSVKRIENHQQPVVSDVIKVKRIENHQQPNGVASHFTMH
jgi:hypothetical protein